MDKMIAYCGLNCLNCEAYKATINNDDALREKVAKEWSILNNIEIKSSDINCLGCTGCGCKTVFCSDLCEIRKCAINYGYKNCGECKNMTTCDKLKMIIGNNNEALNNLLER